MKLHKNLIAFYIFLLISNANICIADDQLPKNELIKSQLISDSEKKSKALNALFSINKKIQKTAVEKSKTHQQVMNLEEELLLTKAQIEDLQKDLQEQKKSLRERLTSLGQISEGAFVYLLINSANFSQIESDIKTLNILTQFDVSEIKKYLSSKKSLEIKKEKVLAKIEKLKFLSAQLDQSEVQLNHSLQMKTKLVHSIQKNQQLAADFSRQMSQDNPELSMADSGVFDGFRFKSFYELKGQLEWPVSGIVVHKFGFEGPTEQKYRISNKGLFIRTPKNSAVKSVAEGEVAFVGDVPTFGKTVIIDHGDHFYTLYSMNSEFSVSSGEKIKAHQVIAKSGQSLLDKEDGLYFEIRHFSEPYDPHRWMKGIRNEITTQ